MCSVMSEGDVVNATRQGAPVRFRVEDFQGLECESGSPGCFLFIGELSVEHSNGNRGRPMLRQVIGDQHKARR